MKIITNNRILTYQHTLDLFKRWIEDVKSTDTVGKRTSKGISQGVSHVFIHLNHPFGDFGIAFGRESITDNNWMTHSGAVVSLISATQNNRRSDQTDPKFKKEAQYISLIVSSGHLVSGDESERSQNVFVSHVLCEVNYLFNQDACARTLRVNGIRVEDLSDINPNLISPVVSTFLTFVTNVVEGGQKYEMFKYIRSHANVWLQKTE